MTDATTAAIAEIPFVCSATPQATPQGFDPFKYGGMLPMKRESIPQLATEGDMVAASAADFVAQRRRHWLQPSADTSSKLPIAAAPYKVHMVLTATGRIMAQTDYHHGDSFCESRSAK
ncbi:hypothetical protein [Bradyrhizobium sp. C9]|uniref:hypothetical protein n=1 Tax=Bradyrhizobium sp. C9 TaxID=142585 RepID=UPI0011776137|nr:hypothetical protein [Bradyrhizobium sp. C9]